MRPDNDIYTPENDEPRHSTQIISLIVGGLLSVLGLSGILFEGFAGLHLNVIYSSIIAISGALLFYTGFKNKGRYAFLNCLVFSIFYGIHAIIGWIFGQPGLPKVGYERMDPKLVAIIPGLHELGRNDHILNTLLALLLMGGAIDWWRRNSQRITLIELFKELKNDLFSKKRSQTNRPLEQ